VPEPLVTALLEALSRDPGALEQLRELFAPAAGEPEPWIGVPEAAAHVACKRQRIYNLVNEGRIPHHRDGSRLLFRRSELDDWVQRSGRPADTVSDRKVAGRRANVPGQ
jgi:excisionase family DNA binding protein